MNNAIKNVKYNLVDSINPKYIEVIVTFTLNGQVSRKFIFLDKEKGYKDNDYIKLAKKQFEEDVKNNKVSTLKGYKEHNKSPLLVGFTSFFAVATLAFAGLFTYKMLVPGQGGGQDDPVIPTGDIEIKFDEDTEKHMSIKPTTANKNEDYVGTITLKTKEEGINVSDVEVMIDGNKLVKGEDFTIEVIGLDGEGKRTYTIKVNADKMTGDLSIKAPTADYTDFKIPDDRTLAETFTFSDTPSLQFEAKETSPTMLGNSKGLITLTPSLNYMDAQTFATTKKQWVVKTGDNFALYQDTGRTKLYIKPTDTKEEFITPGTYPLHQQVVGAFTYLFTVDEANPAPTKEKLIFDDEKLMYKWEGTLPVPDSNLILFKIRVSFYKNKPMTAYVDCKNNGISYIDEFNYTYEFNDPGHPSDEDAYLKDTPKFTEVTTAKGVELLNNIANQEKFSMNINSFSTSTNGTEYMDGSKVAIEEEGKKLTFYDKEDGDDNKCYQYVYDSSSEKWDKKSIPSTKYDSLSGDTMRQLAKDISTNFESKFTYKSGVYTAENILGHKQIDLYFAKATSIVGGHEEIYLYNIKISDSDKTDEYYDFVTDGRVHVDLPEVESSF